VPDEGRAPSDDGPAGRSILPAVSANGRPNVILLVVDALRVDAVEAYGAPGGASPALGQLARRGAAVPDVRTTASWTLPAHTAMFSGQLARGLGLGQAPNQTVHSAAPVVRAERHRLLAEVLRQSGYDTRAVTANGWVGTASGFSSGFERFVDLGLGRQGELGGGVRHRLGWIREGVQARADDGAAQAEVTLAQWLAERGDKPFFWFVNLVECHSPYLPPKPYALASPLARARAADEAFRYLTFASIILACLGRLTVPPGAIERMRHLYRASLRYVDDWLARLLGSLADASVLEDTLVVVCSDHGENFGVQGLMGHGMSLDDRLLRVPLIVAGPGWTAFEGTRSLVELPGRIAAAVGIETHPWPDSLPGGLPVAQWDPFDVTDERREDLVKEYGFDEEDFVKLMTPLTCAVAGRLKLVRGATPEDESLYDLDEDPLELNPLRDRETIEARAGEALTALRAAVNHPLVQATAECAPSPEGVSDEETAELERRMRLMGYM
jgi:arylsulfatase A-like enzyme